MLFRFTLIHDETSHEISEPGGWPDHRLILERHPEFCSLVESLEAELTFYGTDGTEDGGIDFIRQIENEFGVDAELKLKVELSPDEGKTWMHYFTGILKLDAIEEDPDNTCTMPIVADNAWYLLMSRWDTPVDLTSNTTLNGNPCTPMVPVTINLTPQIIQMKGEYTWDESFTYEVDSADPANEKYYQLDFDKVTIDELNKYNVPRATVTFGLADLGRAMPAQFEAPWDGEYAFDIRIVSADLTTGSYNKWTANASQVEFRIGRAGLPTSGHELFTESTEGPYTFTPPGGFPDDEDTLMIATFQGSFTLRKGDQIVIYAVDSGSSASGFDRTFFGETRWTYKTDCAVATTANITLSGEQTIDGVLTSASRVLVKNQGDPLENGIYVSAAGAWSRATDADSAAELNLAAVYVTGGTTNADSAWKQVNTISILDTHAIEWRFLSPSDERLWRYPPAADAVSSYCNIIAATTYKETQAQGFWLHDLFAGIVERILN